MIGASGATGATGAQGPPGSGSGFTSGSGAPTSTGNVGDTYLDTNSGTFYNYSATGGSSVSTVAEADSLNGIVLDASGNIYLSNFNSSKIFKYDISTNTSSVIAGKEGSGGFTDGALAVESYVWNPAAMAIDASGNIFFTDLQNGAAMIDTEGYLHVIPGIEPYAYGIACDSSGTVYVAHGNSIYKSYRDVDGVWHTSAIAGWGSSGFGDITLDNSGNAYTLDITNNAIRKINLTTGIVIPIAQAGGTGYLTGTGTDVTMNFGGQWGPCGITCDGTRYLYFTQSVNNTVSSFDLLTGACTVISSDLGAGFVDGSLATARFSYPVHLFYKAGSVYIADSGNGKIRKITIGGSPGWIDISIGSGGSGGIKGDTGAQGATGATGAQGPPGASGTGAQEYDTLNANMNISGGGTVTWDGTTVSWNQRVIVMNQNGEFAVNGHLNIGPDGIVLGPWQGLYYAPPRGSATPYNADWIHVVNYPLSDEVKADWIFLAHHNGDDGSLRWNPGYVNIPAGGIYNSPSGSCSWLASGSGSGATGATGAQGGPGISIYNGLEIPSNTGAQGDYFINNNTRDIYTYSTNTWNNLFSPEAYFSSVRTSGIILSGTTPPFQSTFTTSTVSTFTSTFMYTGSPATFTIPQGTSTITFQVLGAGGANAGGGGSYVSGTYAVQSGDSSLGIYVGQGGQFGPSVASGATYALSGLTLATSGGSAPDVSLSDPLNAIVLGGGGGAASGIMFPNGTDAIVAAGGAGGFFDGVRAYPGGAGGIGSGSEPAASLPILVTSLDLASDVVDRGTNPQTVTVNGTVPFSTIQGVQSAYFDNSLSNYLSLPFTPFSGTQGTISYWFNAIDTNAYDVLTLGSAATGGFGMNMDTSSGSTLSFAGNPTANGTMITFPSSYLGKWTHIAMSFDLNGTTRFFLDGVLNNSITNFNTWNNGQYMILGKAMDNGRAYNGYTAKVNVYNKALGAAAIMEIYNSQGPLLLAPSSLASSAISSTGFTVSWSQTGPTPTGYTYKIDGSLFTPSTDNGLSARNAVFTGLIPSITYFVEVIAAGFNQTRTSTALSVQMSAPAAPTAITGLASSNVTYNGITVSWSGGTGYGVTTTYTLNGTAATPSSTGTGTARFTGLTAETAYTIVVTATNTGGSVNYSVSATTLATPGFPSISTIAGDGTDQLVLGPSSQSRVREPYATCVDAAGNVYFFDYTQIGLYKINPAGVMSQVTMNSYTGSEAVFGMDVDTQGNIYLTDTSYHCIWKVSTSGDVTLYAGTLQSYGFSGDGDQATSAQLHNIYGIKLDGSGNLYISDSANHRIRRVDNATGVITTVAGNGTSGFSGDGGLATSASINFCIGSVGFDSNGHMYFGDYANHRVRKIDKTTGIISTVVGNGIDGEYVDGLSALNATIRYPHTVLFDSADNIIINLVEKQCIVRVDAVTNIVNRIAGIVGTHAYNGDGTPATDYAFSSWCNISMGPDGSIYIPDYDNNRIRKITFPSTGGGSAPTAITGLASSNITSSAFTVSWSGGTGTGVTRTYTLNGSAATPSSSGAGTATFSGLTASTAYTVQVIATNTAGSVNASLVVTTSAGGGPSTPTAPNFTLTFPNTNVTAQIQFTYDPAVGFASNNTSILDVNLIYDTGAFTASTISPYTNSIYVEVLSDISFSDPSTGTYMFRMQMPQWFLDAAVAELQASPGTESYYNRYTDATTSAFTFVFNNNAYVAAAIDGLPGNNLGTVGITFTSTNITQVGGGGGGAAPQPASIVLAVTQSGSPPWPTGTGIALTATVTDTNGNPLAGQAVSVTGDDTLVYNLNENNSTDNLDGTYTINVGAPGAGTVTYTANIGTLLSNTVSLEYYDNSGDGTGGN